MKPLLHALELATQGRAVVPIDRHSKRPIFKNWQHLATKDPETLRDWFTNAHLIPAVLCGIPSGVMVLDVEAKNGGLEWLVQHRPHLPETEEYETRSGGRHLVFTCGNGQRTVPLGRIHPGVELRSAGALAAYWPAAGFPVCCSAPPAALPSWVLPAPKPAPAPSYESHGLRPTARIEAQLAGLVRTIACAPEGQRNASLFWAGCRVGEMIARGELSQPHAEALLLEAASRAALDHIEAGKTISSAFKQGVS